MCRLRNEPSPIFEHSRGRPGDTLHFYTSMWFDMQKDKVSAMPEKSDLPQGTLDLLILKAVSLGPLHGYGVLLRIGQISGDALKIEQGALYPALYRLERQELLSAEWGVSGTNRRAKFYTITRSGKKQLILETRSWEKVAVTMARILGSSRPTP